MKRKKRKEGRIGVEEGGMKKRKRGSKGQGGRRRRGGTKVGVSVTAL